MSLQVVPLSTAPNQSIVANLTVDGNALTLNLTIKYNQMAGYWIMSVSDVNNNLLVDSIPMTTGGYPAANLLQQQRYLDIGSAYIVNVANANNGTTGAGLGYGSGGYGQGGYGGGGGGGGIDYPDNTNLGTQFQLWWGDTPTS